MPLHSMLILALHFSLMHLGESAAYYVNLASRSLCHLRLPRMAS